MVKSKDSQKEDRISLVFCVDPKKYEIFDKRISKPTCHMKIDATDGNEVGMMVLQEIDQIHFENNNNLEYFLPNNVAILLSISQKSLNEAKTVFDNYLDPYKITHDLDDIKEDKKGVLIKKSKIICDFIERIQSSIVFSYTALEVFSNLSIPENYRYETTINNKGTIEVYDKRAIERWITLRVKLSEILPKIYQTKELKTQKFWVSFTNLERYRNDIIHQKSINRTEFYKNYFRTNVFATCKVAEEIIRFFYQQQANKNKTNPLWPWLINKEKEFPLDTNFREEDFEVVGNIYQGIKNDKKKA